MGAQVSTRWGTAELGPDLGQRPPDTLKGCSREAGKRRWGQEGHYWGSAEAQDAAILDLSAVLQKTAERGSTVKESSEGDQLGCQD